MRKKTIETQLKHETQKLEGVPTKPGVKNETTK